MQQKAANFSGVISGETKLRHFAEKRRLVVSREGGRETIIYQTFAMNERTGETGGCCVRSKRAVLNTGRGRRREMSSLDAAAEGRGKKSAPFFHIPYPEGEGGGGREFEAS